MYFWLEDIKCYFHFVCRWCLHVLSKKKEYGMLVRRVALSTRTIFNQTIVFINCVIWVYSQ